MDSKATGITEKTAHTRHHQKLEKGKKRKLPPGSLRVCGFLSINVVCIFGAPPHYYSWGPNRPGWSQHTVGHDIANTSQTFKIVQFYSLLESACFAGTSL